MLLRTPPTLSVGAQAASVLSPHRYSAGAQRMIDR
jgi:hypothetical protein